MAIVTTAQAIQHLRLPDAPDDLIEIERLIIVAQALVIKYLKRPELLTDSPVWSSDTDPSGDETFAVVQQAILEVLANLYQDRGDRDEPTEGPLTPRLKNLLSLYRDPALA